MDKLLNKMASLMLTALMLAGLMAGFPIEVAAEEADPPTDEIPTAAPASETAQEPAQVAGDGSASPTDLFANTPLFDAEEAVNTIEALGEETDDIYAMLGINTSEPPSDENAAMRASASPYGEKKHTITFDELLVGGHSGSSENPDAYLYGNGAGQNAQINKQRAQRSTLYRNDNAAGANRGKFTFNLASRDGSAAFEGDFTGDGRKSQVAMLTYWDDHRMELWVGNATPQTNGNMEMYKLGSYAPAIGYPSDYRLTSAGAQKDLHVKTGDVNGDGFDEIILLLPHYPGTDETSADKSRLLVYALTTPSSSVNWRDSNQWGVIYDQTFDIGFGDDYGLDIDPLGSRRCQVSRFHSLAVGDLDGDGKEDIVLAGSEEKITYVHSLNAYTGGDSARASLSVLHSGESTSTNYVTQSIKTYTYHSDDDSNTLFGPGALMPLPTQSEVDPEGTLLQLTILPAGLGVEIADGDGTQGNELLVGYNITGTSRINGVYKGSTQSMGYRAYQTRWNGSDLVQVAGRGFQVLTTDIHAATEGNIKGISSIGDVFGVIYGAPNRSYSMGAVRLAAVQMDGPMGATSIMVGNNRHEYTGSGYTLKARHANTTWQYSYYPLSNVGSIFAVRPAVMNTVNDKENTIPAYGYIIHYGYGSYDQVEFISGSNTANPHETSNNTADRLHTGKLNAYGCGFACLPDTDMDAVILEFEDYDYIYTDPMILAALAAPPYVGDIVHTAGPDYNEASKTTFGTSFSTGSGTTESQTNSLGAYAAAEAEIGCLFAAAVVETEVEYKHTWSSELTEAITQKVGNTFSADREDCVVLLVYPMDMYNYTMTYPSAASAEAAGSCQYTVYAPYTPRYAVVTMSEYAKMRAMYPEMLPDIDREIFTHEVGYPDTYTGPPAHLLGGAIKPENYQIASATGDSTTEVTVSTEKSLTTASTNAVDFKIGAGAKVGAGSSVQVTAGITYGHEATKGKSITETNESTYSGTLKGNVYHGSNFYPFSWRMVQYNYRGAANFPVVTYEVEMKRTVQTTPYLPEAFWVDEAHTSDSQITLCWTPSREDSNPGVNSNVIYGVFQKLSGGRYAEVQNTYTYNALEGAYTITHTERGASLSYEYVIRTMRSGNPGNEWSPDSEAIVATTNPTEGAYGFTTQPKDLTITPGASARLETEFAHDTSYTVEYEWQRMGEVSWTTLNDGEFYTGTKTKDLTFASPRAALAGTYHLVATLKSGGILIKQYVSKEVQVDYKKESATILITDIPRLADGQETVTVSARVAKGNPDATETLDGTVRFMLTYPGGSFLLAEAALNGADEASHTFTLPQRGVYMLAATYAGNGTYGLAHAETVNFSNDDSKPLIATTFNPGTVTYTREVQDITAQIYDTGGWRTVAPMVEIRRYDNSGALGSVVGRGQVSSDGTVTHFQYSDAGRFCFVIRYGDSDPIYRDVVVTPRNVEYTIDDVTRYLPTQTPATSDLKIRLTAGSIEEGDALGYNSANLAVYNEKGEPVTLSAKTPAGNYQIRPSKVPQNSRYNVTVHKGTYTVVKGATVHSLRYGLMSSSEGYGTLSAVYPKGHTSGEPVAAGNGVLLVAEAAEGYMFNGWHDETGAGIASTRDGKDYYEIGNIDDDCEVWAEFVRIIRVDAISIDGPAGPYRAGNTYTFTANVAGVGLEDDSVVWSLRGANSGETWIDPETGKMTLAEDESTTTLTLVATTVVDPSFSETQSITIQPSGVYLNMLDNGENVTDLVLAMGEVRPLALIGSGTITGAEAPSNSNAVLTTLSAGTLTLTGARVGTAIITLKATVGDQSITRPLSVRVIDNNGIAIGLSKTALTLAKGADHKLKATFTPSKTPYSELVWSSGDEGVATVDFTGKVAAVAPGRTTITYTATPLGKGEPAIIRTCVVTVTSPASSVKLRDDQGNILPKSTTIAMTGSLNAAQMVPHSRQLLALVAPADTTDNVVWSSSNTAVATVDPAGNVTGGTKPGTATITAKAGKKSAKHTVRVVATVPDGGVSLNVVSAELKVKGTLSLKPKVAKHTIGKKTYSTSAKLDWSTSNPLVATVSTGGKVTAKGIGNATITAASRENPNILARCTIRVTAPVTSVQFTKSDFTMRTSTATVLNTVRLGLIFNNGTGVSDELAGMVLTLSDTKALTFHGEGASADGKTYQLTDPNALVTLLATDALPGGETKRTTTLTAKTTHKSYKKPVSATKLKITVTSDSLVQVSGRPTITNIAEMPGCGSDDAGSPNPALAVGRSFTPKVNVEPGNASDKNITWTIYAYWKYTYSEYDNVVDPYNYVDFNTTTGKVTARKPTEMASGSRRNTYIYVTGTATNGEKLSYTFRTMTFASKVAISTDAGASSASVNTGSSIQLAATIAPANATANSFAKKVNWTSKTPDIATVDDNGLVTAGAQGGTAIIMATATDDSRVSGSFKVTVRQSLVDAVITSVRYDSAKTPAYGVVSIAQGSTKKLSAKLNAANSVAGSKLKAKNAPPYNRKVRWEVVSEVDGRTGQPAPGRIVSLNTKTGAVKGLADGTAVIRLIPDGYPDSVSFDDIPVWRKVGKTFVEERFSNTIQVQVAALAKSVKIDQTGFRVHGGREVSLTLSATTTPGLNTLTSPTGNVLKWRIPAKDGLDFDLTAPGMADGLREEVTLGGKAMVVYTAPADSRTVTLKTKTVEENTDFKLTVEIQGKKAKAYSITIKVTADEKSAPILNGASLKKSASWLKVGGSEKLATTMTPINPKPGNRNLHWSLVAYTPNGSRLPDNAAAQVATVDATGKVTAKGCGYVVITARSVDGKFHSSCKVYCIARN